MKYQQELYAIQSLGYAEHKFRVQLLNLTQSSNLTGNFSFIVFDYALITTISEDGFPTTTSLPPTSSPILGSSKHQ